MNQNQNRSGYPWQPQDVPIIAVAVALGIVFGNAIWAAIASMYLKMMGW